MIMERVFSEQLRNPPKISPSNNCIRKYESTHINRRNNYWFRSADVQNVTHKPLQLGGAASNSLPGLL
jgi:hypothetical protein